VLAAAFDLDFDDSFAFFRRRPGVSCAGADAARSGLPLAAGLPATLRGPEQFVRSFGEQFTLLSRTVRVPPRALRRASVF
jgi:hypothetical protein